MMLICWLKTFSLPHDRAFARYAHPGEFALRAERAVYRLTPAMAAEVSRRLDGSPDYLELTWSGEMQRWRRLDTEPDGTTLWGRL